MKVKIELDLQESEYEHFQKMVRALNTREGVEGFLKREFEGYLGQVALWMDRTYITATRF